jgi:hypothetical protein
MAALSGGAAVADGRIWMLGAASIAPIRRVSIQALSITGNITVAFRALPNKQQVARSNRAGKIADRDLMAACATPDIGEQLLSDVSRDCGVQLGGRWCELGQSFDGHGSFSTV